MGLGLKKGAPREQRHAAHSLRPTAGVLRAQGLPPALGEHRGPLHARRQHHGLGQRRHLLLLLAQDAGQHLPLGGRGAALGAQGHAALPLLRDTGAGGGWDGGGRQVRGNFTIGSTVLKDLVRVQACS